MALVIFQGTIVSRERIMKGGKKPLTIQNIIEHIQVLHLSYLHV